MKLSRLAIQNHSRLADLEIEIRDHLVLVGANDVGKSSVLRCLDLVLGATAAQLYANISSADFRDESQPFSVEVTLTDFSLDEMAMFPDEITVGTKGASTLVIRLEAELDSSGTVSITRTAPSGRTGRQLSRDQLASLGWKFLSATNQTRELRQDRKSPVDEILSNVDLGIEKTDFEDIAELLEKKLESSAILGKLRDGLAGQLSKALPETIAKDDLTLVPGASADNDVLSDVRLRVSKDGNPRDLSEQSDGMKALFAIAFYDLVSGFANVVGIDEPEVHLHPTSQRSLARLLKSRSNQKIIATHSSDVVSAFDPGEIVVVHHGGRVVQPKAGFLSTEEKLLANWWVQGRLEPLTARRAIAVEGVSDRIIVEKAADLTNRNLDRLGVSLVDAGGKNSMAIVEKLFGPDGFDVPLTIVVDEDAEKDCAKRRGVDKSDLPQQSIWISCADLEDEYAKALGASRILKAFEESPLFPKNQLQTMEKTGANGETTDSDVANFCRKHKVEAAVTVAGIMRAEDVKAMTSVDNALAEIVSV